MKSWFMFALVVLVVFPSGDTVARTFEEAEAAYKKGDYKTAMRIVFPLANRGDPRAQDLLSDMYWSGRGIDRDRCKSTKWADKAARQNLGRAQYSMAWAYFSGHGVYRNSELTYRWALAAIRSGSKRASGELDLFGSELQEFQRLRIRKSMATWRAEDQPPVQIIRLSDTLFGRLTGYIRGVRPCLYAP
ncbi:MAG: tetratricopeptide repeat protein [Alphaproteobacteria bacterium]